MSFGMYLVAFFCSPLYFLIRGKMGAALLNGFFYFLALATLLVFGLGIFFWFFCALHAMWDLRSHIRSQEIKSQAEAIAREMGKK